MSGFSARRRGRKIGQDEEGGDGEKEAALSSPTPGRASFTASHKLKKRSSLRLSFGPGQTSMTDDDEGSVVFTPKRPSLARQTLEKNANRKKLGLSHATEVPLRTSREERPTYSKEYLDDLKSSTPSTPKDLRDSSSLAESGISDMDIISKFGSSYADTKPSIIPTEAEIREKKERRARLAHEQDFISLKVDDGQDFSWLPRRKKPDTRLVRDDEDFAEGFEEFVEDGKIALGRKAKRDQKRRHKEEIRQLIEDAEGSSDEDSDDSEYQRREVFEEAQTRSAMEGLPRKEDGKLTGPRTPPKITPLPNLGACLQHLQSLLSEAKYSKAQKVKALADLQKEKAEIVARESEIQKRLDEAGKNYKELANRSKVDLLNNPGSTPEGNMINTLPQSRGLESFGNNMDGSTQEDK